MVRKVARAISRLGKIYRNPTHLKVILGDLFRLESKIYSDNGHLHAAMEWLCRAQDATGCGGVSAGYSFYEGWKPPYPETTGYIIPTFLRYAFLSGEDNYIERAITMGDWEIEIQLPTGAVRGGIGINDYPIIFNTGQVIFGWTSLYKKANLTRFLDAAKRAADWLISVQDSDGKWSNQTLKSIPTVYHTRVAWSLFKVYGLIGDKKYKIAAEKHILWTLTQAKGNGWFGRMSFTLNQLPNTHAIAYTLQGLMESSFYLTEEIQHKILSIVKKASENIMEKYMSREKKSDSSPRYLPAIFDEEWESQVSYSCPTGNVQISNIWLKLYKITNDTRFLKSALELIDSVKATQKLECRNTGIRGGIPGSYPIWGKYEPYFYPNWAAKFFVDALLLKGDITQELD
jgi:hypothetical protein